MSNSEIAILAAAVGGVIGGLFGVFGTWLGQRWNHKNTIETIKLYDSIKATSNFRSAFLDTKYRLWSTIEDRPGKRWKTIDAVEDDYSIHERVYFRFREFLTIKDERTTLDDAWNKYICKPHKDDELQELFLDYLPIKDRSGLKDSTEEECNQLALDNIEALLKFTK